MDLSANLRQKLIYYTINTARPERRKWCNKKTWLHWPGWNC